MFSNDEAGIGNEDAWLMKKKKKGWGLAEGCAYIPEQKD